MLEEIGFQAKEDLFGHIPEEVKVKGSLAIPKGMSELEVRRKMQKIAGKNQVFGTIFRGAGAYRHFYTFHCKERDLQGEPAYGLYAISGRD